MSNGGPTNKVVKFSTQGLSSNDVLDKLDQLGDAGYSSYAVTVDCADGPFVFVGGYSSENPQ